MGKLFNIGGLSGGAIGFSGPEAVSKPNWSLPSGDKSLLRELAKQYVEIAANPINAERIRRVEEMHSLKPVRPPVLIDELPWNEMNWNGELTLRCESEEARILEEFFRRTLFRWKHFPVDMVVEDNLYLMKAYTNTGIGIGIDEDIRATDKDNDIVSHGYKDQLDTEARLEALKTPVIKAYPEIDAENVRLLCELFDGILTVKLRGYFVSFSTWDSLAMYRGVTPCLNDIIDRPEFIHKTVAKFTELDIAAFDQMLAQGLLDWNIETLHCTPAHTSELPAKDYTGTVRYQDMWYRGMAQPLSMVSPAMREEFEFDYIRPFMSQFGLVYYGCCESLDNCMDILKTFPNMRKIGCSPWAKVRRMAEESGGRFVIARKPNPATVAVGLDEDALRREISETVDVCMANNCPYEFVLKDVSTVGKNPENIFNWARIVTDILDTYY
jgi:hypothetical protein